jgi:hypothetical protein
MIKKITMFMLLVFMAVGIFISIANFIANNLESDPCVPRIYYPEIPDCRGTGTSCNDCTGRGGLDPSPQPW